MREIMREREKRGGAARRGDSAARHGGILLGPCNRECCQVQSLVWFMAGAPCTQPCTRVFFFQVPPRLLGSVPGASSRFQTHHHALCASCQPGSHHWRFDAGNAARCHVHVEQGSSARCIRVGSDHNCSRATERGAWARACQCMRHKECVPVYLVVLASGACPRKPLTSTRAHDLLHADSKSGSD
jgi:hypothetical protein